MSNNTVERVNKSTHCTHPLTDNTLSQNNLTIQLKPHSDPTTHRPVRTIFQRMMWSSGDVGSQIIVRNSPLSKPQIDWIAAKNWGRQCHPTPSPQPGTQGTTAQCNPLRTPVTRCTHMYLVHLVQILSMRATIPSSDTHLTKQTE